MHFTASTSQESICRTSSHRLICLPSSCLGKSLVKLSFSSLYRLIGKKKKAGKEERKAIRFPFLFICSASFAALIPSLSLSVEERQALAGSVQLQVFKKKNISSVPLNTYTYTNTHNTQVKLQWVRKDNQNIKLDLIR